MLRDLRQAGRSLRQNPGFTVLAVLTLGLGIGAATAIFSAINTVLLRPLPSPELDRVVVVRQDIPMLDLWDTELAPVEVEELGTREDLFQSVGGFTPRAWNLTGGAEPMRLGAALTMGDFFQVFRIRPHLGRLYTAEYSWIGEHEVVVLSYALWQQVAGGDPAIIGTTLQLDGLAREVIGVLPPGFEYPRGTQIYKPINYTPELREQRGRLIMTAVGRLQQRVTMAGLGAGLDAQATRWNEEFHDGATAKVLNAVPFIDHMAGPLRLVLLVLMAAVGLVLLIACANVAGLQLVRSAGRERELAVRTAVGAGRSRIVRRLLAESLLLAAGGGLLGLLMARAALGGSTRWNPLQRHAVDGIVLDSTVVAFVLFVSLASAMLSGVIPALRAARVDPQQVLRETSTASSAGRSRLRFLQGFVVVQIALALVLLVGAGLMVRSVMLLLRADVGFQPEDMVTAQVSLPATRYPDVARQAAFYDALVERLEAVPGVEAAAVGWALPFSEQIRDSSPFTLPERPARPDGPVRHAEYRVVSGSYFRTLGIPLLRGRTFAPSDHLEAPTVALVDEHFAEQFFPGEDPVGRRISHVAGEATIVGVVGTVHHGNIGESPKALAYYHYRQTRSGWMAVAVRTPGDPGAVAPAIRSAVAEIDPDIPLYDVATMEQRIRHSLGGQRLAVASLAAFGASALLLSLMGVYGVVRYSTSQRTREIGIRIALGARRANVIRLVVGQGFALTAGGVLLGLVGAFALTRIMSGMLYGVAEWDPFTFTAGAVILALTALLAAYLPARRAARIDPATAIRAE